MPRCSTVVNPFIFCLCVSHEGASTTGTFSLSCWAKPTRRTRTAAELCPWSALWSERRRTCFTELLPWMVTPQKIFSQCFLCFTPHALHPHFNSPFALFAQWMISLNCWAPPASSLCCSLLFWLTLARWLHLYPRWAFDFIAFICVPPSHHAVLLCVTYLLSPRLLWRSLSWFRSCSLPSRPSTKNMPLPLLTPTNQQTAQLATSQSRVCLRAPPQITTP